MTKNNRALPRAPRSLLKKLRYYANQFIDRHRHRDGMVPPRSLNFVGGGNFEDVGLEFRQHFIQLGHLMPNHRVLDVGSGIGRMAIPLTNYLTADGEYVGFDIVKVGIDWCNERIAPQFPNFRFLLSDVQNDYYNAAGAVKALDYRFPFDDSYFDFVFLTSVFTHMFPAALSNYLGEIARVLKPGGRCLITFFLMNEESGALVREGKANPDFRFPLEGCWTANQQAPEGAIAFDEQWVRQLFAAKGLTIEEPIHFGSWCGRPRITSYQDIVVARRNTL